MYKLTQINQQNKKTNLTELGGFIPESISHLYKVKTWKTRRGIQNFINKNSKSFINPIIEEVK